MARAVPSVGDPAPDFTLTAASGEVVALAALRGKRVVLYFYPKDDTPGCTKQACDFRDSTERWTAANTVILGVSCDDVASHQKFTDKFRLNFPLLSDPDTKVCTAYGVYKEKSLYGHTYMGIERTTFVIDERGRIAAVFPKVRVEGHADAVLQTLSAAPKRTPAKHR